MKQTGDVDISIIDSSEEFNKIIFPDTFSYEKKCAICGKEFISDRLNKNLCSFECKREHNRQHSRFYARTKRKKITNGGSCSICGFNLTVDLHRENNLVVVLCPNHHCLITRGIKTLKDLLSEKLENEIKKPLK